MSSTDPTEADIDHRVTVQTPPPLRGQAPASADGSLPDRQEPSAEEKPVSSEETSSLARTLLWGLGGAGLLALGGYVVDQTSEPPMIDGTDLVEALTRSPAGREILQAQFPTREERARLRAGRFPRSAVIDWLSQIPAGREVLREWGWPICS